MSPTTWVCPVGVTSVRVECWGGGGGGAGGNDGSGKSGGGGGGGAYSSLNAMTVVPGTSYTVTVGAGGAAGALNTDGGDGADSWFSSSATVLAKAGIKGLSNAATGGAGGAAGSGIGDITKSGGVGGPGVTLNGGGGGGGSAGDKTDGAAGVNLFPGASGASLGGRGGDGVSSATGKTGSAPGGGASGGSQGPTNIGAPGAAGMVRLTYTVPAGLPTTSTNDIDPDTNRNYQNLAVDDGDYFIQYGSEYMIQEYKLDWINNTDVPTFTWKGRTTYDTRVSPFYVQIYNVNSATWETLTRETRQPADIDFTVVVRQVTNVSNYYDSSNIVTFRTYQQVL